MKRYTSKALAPALIAKAQDGPLVVSPLTPLLRQVGTIVDTRSPVDQMLASCPTTEEIEDIYRNFRFSIDGGTTTPYSCTPNGTESSEMLTAINMFRLAKLIHFDAPIPLLNATNLWDWMRAQNFRSIRFSQDAENSNAGNGEIVITISPAAGAAEQFRRSAFGGAGILVHEGWHAAHPSPHICDLGGVCCPTELDARRGTCSPRPAAFIDDPSLEYGGAWAAQFWYFRWLARHSGDYLSETQRRTAEENADAALSRMARRPTGEEIHRIEAPYLGTKSSGTLESSMNHIMQYRPTGVITAGSALAVGSEIRVLGAPINTLVHAEIGGHNFSSDQYVSPPDGAAGYHRIYVSYALDHRANDGDVATVYTQLGGGPVLTATTVVHDGITPLAYGEFRDPTAWTSTEKTVAAGIAIVTVVGIGYALWPKDARHQNPSRRSRR